MIRLTVPSIEQDDLAAVAEVLESGYLVQGPRVEGFERAVAERVGVRHAVAVTNCTAAIQMALLAAGVRAGDVVVTTAYSWPATANAVELCGAQPVFVDVRPDTFNIDPAALEAVLARLMSCGETAGRTRAVLPVHAFGLLADMPAIMGLADRYGLAVVEDAACALGAAADGRQAGAWGALGCFSFHPRKAVTTGEGGVVTTDDDAAARRLRALRNHGLDPAAPGPDFILPGFNNRMTEMQGALGLTQMTKLDRIVAARRRAAARYDQLFEGSEFRPPVAADHAAHVYQSYVIQLPPRLAAARAELIAAARGRGIETTIGTWHMPLVTYYRSRYGFRPGDFPVADDVFARSLTLPLHERLTEAEQGQVADFFLGHVA
jgi:dTDP-4-amino-4,6-dideoxygalactose transaminase